MSEIICPHCGKTISVNESDYASVLNQVRNKEFDKEIKKRTEELQKTFESESKLKEQQIEASKDKEIAELKQKINTNDVNNQLAVSKIENKYKDEIAKQKQEIANLNNTLRKLGLYLSRRAD